MNMKRRILSILVSIVMVVGLVPVSVITASAEVGHTHIGTDPDSDCIVCQVAGMINALPEAENITIDNAAAVIDQIHAIDRAKVQLDADSLYDLPETEAMLALVETVPNPSGVGYPEPKGYVEAVAKIRCLGGNSIYIQKSFEGYDSAALNEAMVEFTVTGENGYVQTLTMSAMDYLPNSLSADPAFYSADATGWTYKYLLPAGTYTITETQDCGADSTVYSVNGQQSSDSATVNVAEGGSYLVDVINSYGRFDITVGTIDIATGMKLDGATIQLLNAGNETVDEWVSDGNDHTISQLVPGQYTLRSAVLPAGYAVVEDITVTITTSGEITTTGSINDEGVLLVELKKADTVDACFSGTDGTEAGIPVVRKADGSELKFRENDEGDYSYGENRIYPVVNFELKGLRNENNQHTGKTEESVGGLIVGEMYKIVSTKVPEGFTLEDKPMYLDVNRDDEGVYFELTVGALDSDDVTKTTFRQDDNILLPMKAEYEAHTYTMEWPVNTYSTFPGTVPVSIDDGESIAVGLYFDEVNDAADSITNSRDFQRLVYDANGNKIEYSLCEGILDSSIQYLYEVESTTVAGDTTTIKIKKCTFDVKFEYDAGVEFYVTDLSDKVLYDTTKNTDKTLTLIAAENVFINYTEVPAGYSKDWQSMFTDQNAWLYYDGNYISENVKTLTEAIKIGPKKAETYNVTVEESENGTVTADVDSAYEGKEVTLTVSPAVGCGLKELNVTGVNGTVATICNDDGTYTFVMPYYEVTVKATFVKMIAVDTNDDGEVDKYVDPDEVIDGVYTDPETGDMYEDTDRDDIFKPVENPVLTELTPGDGTGVKVGDEITYKISYKNYKDSVAEVKITDVLNPNVEFVSANNGGTEKDGTVTWRIVGIPAGAGGTVTLTVRVLEDALNAEKVENKAQVQVDDDTAFETNTVENPVLKTYTITLVTNEGTICDGNVTEYTYGVGAKLPTNVTRSGYSFGGWYANEDCTGTPVTEIATTDFGDKNFYAKWNFIDEGDTACPRDRTCPMYGYSDLDRTAWYHDGVHFCIENDLMIGIAADTFAPDMTTSRAMIVTILWRLEGQPVVNYAMSFKDVAADTWYTEAVRWAQANKIVLGYSKTTFAPEDVITREQIATILYRYEQCNGGGLNEDEGIRMDFVDLADVSDWAYEAMCWMNLKGVMIGKPSKILDPLGSATRAEAATMLYRYCEVMTTAD